MNVSTERGKTINYHLPVIGERIYFAVYINIEENEIINIRIETNNSVYFRADSVEITLMKFCKTTNLQSTGGRNKGADVNLSVIYLVLYNDGSVSNDIAAQIFKPLQATLKRRQHSARKISK